DGYYLVVKTINQSSPTSNPTSFRENYYKLNSEHLDTSKWHNYIFATASRDTSHSQSKLRAGLWIDGLFQTRHDVIYDGSDGDMHGLNFEYVGGAGLTTGDPAYQKCFDGQIDGIAIWRGGGTGQAGYETIMTDDIAKVMYKNGAGHNPLWADTYAGCEYPSTHDRTGYLQWYCTLGDGFWDPSANAIFGVYPGQAHTPNDRNVPFYESNQLAGSQNSVYIETAWKDVGLGDKMWTIPVMHDAASGTYTNNINQGVMPWGVTECIEVVDLVEDAGQYGMMAGGDSGTGNSSSSSLNLNDNTDGHHDDWYEAPVNLHTSAIGSFSSLVLGNSQIGFNVCGEGEAIQGGSSAIDNVSISFWVSGNQTPTAGDTIISLNTLFTNSNDGIGAYLT
ncbi:MAG: hypothetical protein QF704_14560, partial [Anaerolineales bacterium]|nr:hypothetical protein [Anaerolineales bacterium]